MRGHGGDFDAFPEVGWLFDGAFDGQGYAREAMLAVLEWYDRAGIAGKSVCMIDPDNVASMRLAEKTGFVKTRTSLFDGTELQLFERKSG
jgi:RimJ/RimL family protein N-acetyltransferase